MKDQSAAAVAMRTTEMRNASGVLTGFSISRLLMTRRGVTRVARGIPGCRIIREQARFRFGGREGFAEFSIDAQGFLAVEPFGDNRVFWIVAEPPTGDTPQLRKLLQVFESHRNLLGLLPSNI